MWRRHVQHAWWTADAESFKSANAFLVDFLDKKNTRELELEVNACSEFERYSGVGDQIIKIQVNFGCMAR